MKNIETKMNKISKMAETSYLLYIHTYIQTYIHIILKSEKIKNLNAIFAFVNNVNFRREILKWNFSPFHGEILRFSGGCRGKPNF